MKAFFYQYLGITLLVIYFMTILKPCLPLVDYTFNYHYIVSELCENRNKPELDCHGKCHLQKQLSKTRENSEKENKLNLSVLENLEAHPLIQQWSFSNPTNPTGSHLSFDFSYPNKYYASFIAVLSPPPKV